MNRRIFIQKAGTAGTALLLAGIISESKGLNTNIKKSSINEIDNAKNNMNNSEMTGNCTCLGMYDEISAPIEIEKNITSKLGLNWLSKGDSVFLKVSSNSGNPHPSVTSPIAINIIVKILKNAGAGEIMIGDQAGVQHVRLTKTGRKSSTKEMLAKNGILNSVEITKSKLYCFDDFGWNSYYEPKELSIINIYKLESI